MFILDTDPKKAVESLTKKEIQEYYEIFSKHFNYLMENQEVFKHEHKFMYRSVYRYKFTVSNQASYLFYLNFFFHLEHAVGEITGVFYADNRKYSNKQLLALKDLLPVSDGEIRIICDERSNIKIADTEPEKVVVINKIAYIEQNHFVDEFYYPVPTWLIDRQVILYERYSLKTRQHIKIVYNNKRYEYYTKDWKNNWQKFSTFIPECVDTIINTILFN